MTIIEELLRDIEALCDAVGKNAPQLNNLGYWHCTFCSGSLQHDEKHKPDCPVLLARRIRERMKADG